VAAASVGEGVNKDVSAKLAEQACGEEASRKGADVRDTKLDEEARAPLAEAKAAWEAMASLLETCSHLEYSERNTCIVAAEQWIAASEKLTVTIPAGVELVPTACGEREAVFAETQRSVAVLELVAARQMLERLRATLIPEPSPPTKATEIPSQCPWASAGRAHTTTTMGYVFINGQRYGVRGAEARSAFETILTACGGRDAIEPFQSWRKSRRRTNTVIMVYPLAFFPALAAGKHRNALLLALNASTPPPGRPATIPDVSLAKYRWLHGYNYNKVRRGGSPTNQP
jgi:hypothetical protein